jgi:Bacterial Ig domain/Protein of unknown function (DUF1214)
VSPTPARGPRHAARGGGYGCYVGRVGALAVALGIGAAIANNPGIALAEDTDSSAGAPVGTSAPAASPVPKQRKPKVTFGSTAAEMPKHQAGETAGGADATNGPGESEAADSPEEAPVAGSGGKHRRTEKPRADKAEKPAKAAVPKASGRVPEKDSAPTVDAPDTEPDDAATPAVTVDPSPAKLAAAKADTVVAQVDPGPTKPLPVVTKLVTGVLSAVGLSSPTTNGPTAPLQPSTVTGVLGLISREIEYTLFNHKPKISYDSALNTQTAAGQITGNLDGTDADGDTLTYSVIKGPENGSVTVGSDGNFAYTPYANLAAAGGTDTFTVKASDVPGNPFHLHGFALFSGSATAEVTVQVAPTTAVSPLGTKDQIDAEKLATQIVNSPIVKLAKVVLKLAWRAAAEKNFALIGGPDAENLAALDRAVDEYALQAALELQLLNPNDPHVLQQVMPPHTWYGETFGGARILYDNPDTIYRMIPVNESSSYVITGRFDGPKPADTTFSVLTGLTGTTTSVLTGRDLVLNGDGSFTITVDSTPADGRPNHLQLPTGATLITARNTLSDWSTQVPMSLSVERIDGPPNNLFSQLGAYDIPLIGSLFSSVPIISPLLSLVPPLKSPPLVLRAAETAIVMALGLIMEPQYMAVATTDSETGELKPPNTLSDPAHNASFLATQLQSAGYFQLDDTEALVITIDPGNARYFNVPVTNDWTITDDYWDEQTSLNNVQAKKNPDGTYTLVVSPTEPCGASGCVANWVSTGGLNQGTLSIRFQDLDPDSDVTPTVSAKVVSLDDLASVLPPTTVYVTPEKRAAALAVRKAGYNKRYAPYPQV